MKIIQFKRFSILSKNISILIILRRPEIKTAINSEGVDEKATN